MTTKKLSCIGILIAVFFTFFSSAQTVQLVPPINFHDIHHGDSIVISISNTGPDVKAFYAKTVFDSTYSHIFLSDSDFIAYIKAAGGQIEQIKRLAYVLKSNRFINDYIEPDDGWNQSLINKRYSVAGFAVASSHHQCGNYAEFAARILVATGAFSRDSLIRISARKHQVLECVMDGARILLDFDPGEPLFLSVLPTGQFMSLDNYLDSSQYLFGQLYRYQDPVSGVVEKLVSVGGDGHSISAADEERILDSSYLAILDRPFLEGPPLIIQNRNDSSLIRLPQGATLTYKLKKAPRIVVLTVAQRDSLIVLMDESDSLFLGLLSEIIGISHAELIDELMHDEIVSFDSGYTTNDVVTNHIYNPEMEIYFHLDPQLHDTYIGPDFKLPFWVHQIETNNPITIGDTTFPIGVSKMCLWNQKMHGDTTCYPGDDALSLSISPGQLNMVQSGFIPAGTTVDMVLYYNQFLYPFINGLTAEFFGGDTTGLAVKTTLPEITTSIQEVSTGSTIKAYPNPCKERISIESTSEQSYEIFSIVGNRVRFGSLSSGKNGLDVSQFVSGIYILKTKNSTVRFVKQD